MRFCKASKQQFNFHQRAPQSVSKEQLARNQLHMVQNYIKLITYTYSVTHVATINNFR